MHHVGCRHVVSAVPCAMLATPHAMSAVRCHVSHTIQGGGAAGTPWDFESIQCILVEYTV